MENDFISYFLPSGILEQFLLKNIVEFYNTDTENLEYHIYLEEKNILPEGYSSSEYTSKGFFNDKKIVDFPIRNRGVFLFIKRRRWRHKIDRNIHISTDCTFITEGAKITKELSDFLKGGSGDEDRYDV